MQRSELEHLIRAAGAVSGDSCIVVIGSQSVLGQFPDAPRSLRVSMEVDVFPAKMIRFFGSHQEYDQVNSETV